MGFHLEDLVINGLDRAPVDSISTKIADMGFNCVRLVYALDTLYENPVVKSERVSENPELIGKTVMDVLDAVIDSLTQASIMVILNNHVSTILLLQANIMIILNNVVSFGFNSKCV